MESEACVGVFRFQRQENLCAANGIDVEDGNVCGLGLGGEETGDPQTNS
jgi:hypothetical protein